MSDPLAALRDSLSGSYSLDRELGRGGMAVVYLARDLRHRRRVAIKVLHPELAASTGSDRFLREIEIAASLDHPHILSMIDSGEVDGLYYFVMPFVEGESLRDRLEREKQLPIEEAVRIGHEVADGLGYAHRHGVIHRDIKPANIMLSEGHALIADFGVAKAVGSDGGGLTRTGLAVGTPAYMSPEQAGGTADVGPRSDVYALGCVIYEMLAGEPPLTGATPQAIASRRLTETATALPVLRETVPGGLDRVVRKAIARTAVDRYDTGAELAAALASPAVWEEVKPPRRIGRRAVAAAVAVALLGAGVWLSQFFAARGPAVETDPDLLAVLPLVPAAGGDAALDELGHAVAALISSNLDGMGSIRTANLPAIEASVGSTVASSAEAAQRVGREMGAGRVIQGTLTRVGADEVSVDVALYDPERTSLARASFTAATDERQTLADSLAWRLLDQMWLVGSADTREYYYRSLLRGRPFAAVREYMLADRQYWDGEPGAGAPQAYERAYRADTTLWMASYMYNHLTIPGSFVDPGVRDSAVADAWRAHVKELPVPYQLWIEAWSIPSRPPPGHAAFSQDAIERLREMLSTSGAIPRGNFGPVLYRLGDALVHGGRVYGYAVEYMIQVMKSAIQKGFGGELFDPDHLMWPALGRDEAATQLWLDHFVEGGGPNNDPDSYRFWRLAVDHLGGRTNSALADSVVAVWESLDLGNLRLLRSAGLPDLALALLDRIPPPQGDVEQREQYHVQRALAWADRGAWDPALIESREISGTGCMYCGADPYFLAAMGVWLEGLSREEADRFRPAAVSFVGKWGDDCPDCGVWLASVDGLVASRTRDVGRLRDALRRVGSAQVGPPYDGLKSYVERSLRAAERELSGDRRGAADSLLVLLQEWPYPPRVPGGGYGLLEAANRLSAARWLRAEGDPDRARTVALELQFPTARGYRSPFDRDVVMTFSGLAYLELARIEETRARTAVARDYYEQFLRRYDMPVEAQRPLVEEARKAYVRLGGEPGRFD